MKEIKAKNLTEIISYKKTPFQEDNHKYFSGKNSTFQFDYDSYIKKIKTLITQKKIENHFNFIENKTPEVIKENGYEYFVKYKIIITNLRISCINDNFSFNELPITESYPQNSKFVKDIYQGGIYIEFFNNEFVNDRKGYNSYINFTLGVHSNIKFNHNIFSDVDLMIATPIDKTFVELINNKFLNRHLTISGAENCDNRKNYLLNGWSLKKDVIAKLYGAKRIEGKINEDNYLKKRNDSLNKIENSDISNKEILQHLIDLDEKIKVHHDDIEYSSKNIIINIQDNLIKRIEISGKYFFFKGKNIIEKLSSKTSPELIYYGPYNQLDSKGKNARFHKTLFISLKEHAIKSKDTSQELILNKELLKCERHILREEGKRSGRDRFILWFNEKSSDFGSNWILPIKWILLINFLFFLIFFSANWKLSLELSDILNSLGLYFELLIPTNSLAKILMTSEINKGWEALNIIKNIASSALIYQTISAFRKFKNK